MAFQRSLEVESHRPRILILLCQKREPSDHLGVYSIRCMGQVDGEYQVADLFLNVLHQAWVLLFVWHLDVDTMLHPYLPDECLSL